MFLLKKQQHIHAFCGHILPSATGNTCPEPLSEMAPSEEGPSSQKTGARNPGGQKAALSPPGEPGAGARIAGYYEQAGLSSLFVCIPSDEMAGKPLQCLSCNSGEHTSHRL